jgi:hypothetical protein
LSQRKKDLEKAAITHGNMPICFGTMAKLIENNLDKDKCDEAILLKKSTKQAR